mmetsp:Transcript_70489/g.131834  ORF Transcript_70489/g.131834 Transcript_70489/m.131834 type:complete len:236 (+) Transcript_70489:69-776(+)
MIITLGAVGGCMAGLSAAAGAPYAIAWFLSRTMRILLGKKELCSDVRLKLLDTYMSIDDTVLAEKVLGPSAQQHLQEMWVQLMKRPDACEAVVAMMRRMVKNEALAETIRKGVLEALRNEQLRAQLKEMLIQGLRDDDLRVTLTKALVQTVKAGIRDSIEDAELRMVIVAAIRESLEDPRMTGVIKTALTDVLADKDVHRATRHGVGASMNPLDKLGEQLRKVPSEKRGSLAEDP